MDESDTEVLKAAVVALNDRTPEPFVALMSDDMVWSGQPSGWFWWRRAPT